MNNNNKNENNDEDDNDNDNENDNDNNAILDMYLLLNSKQPLSLVNCISRKISTHSLGWTSNSIKPPIAYAMCYLPIIMMKTKIKKTITNNNDNNDDNDKDNNDNNVKIKNKKNDNDNDNNISIIINTMCGREGTIELESQDKQLHCYNNNNKNNNNKNKNNNNNNNNNHSFFMISGDKSMNAVKDAAKKLSNLYYNTTTNKTPNTTNTNNINTNTNTATNNTNTTTTNNNNDLHRCSPPSSSPPPPLIDFVIWDAQNLPLRSNIADVFLADLPLVGSKKKTHQEPCISMMKKTKNNNNKDDDDDNNDTEVVVEEEEEEEVIITNSLDFYRLIMAQSLRILKCTGRAVMVTVDSKALSSAAGKYIGRLVPVWRTNINISGLTGKLFVMEKHKPCTKDLSLWICSCSSSSSSSLNSSSNNNNNNVDNNKEDESIIILKNVALDVCNQFYLNNVFDLIENNDNNNNSSSSKILLNNDNQNKNISLITKVEMKDSYFCTKNNMLSYCYRLYFDSCMSNAQTKNLENRIRNNIKECPPDGMKLR